MGCVLWKKGKTGAGYGVVYVNGKQHSAHRWAYEQVYGEIPKGMFVCHKCDTPTCVNPDHLFLGSHSDNMRDMYNKERQGKGSFRKGEKHRNAKLKETDVIEIKKLIGSEKYRDIAKRYGVSETAVADIKLGRTWGHVKV